ncbi:727_t:CDS:2 [Diversispora eburnea]|uniref:727_t:CDS:1 n=1 Tax=Diversispora eburnea TaxID=1213867 RepID=A0A9N9FMK7_9GLOM|nr:727_t:CDS:2 [Diversispora eburnea]
MTIKLIFSPPEVITREQAAQTYQDISPEGLYPIIHYIQNNVRILITPPVAAVFLGKGTLWVTESKVFFYSSESNNGLAIDYPTIILHAITRQEAEGRCVYLQLDENFNNVATRQEIQGSLQNSEEEEDKITEIKLFPDDGGVHDRSVTTEQQQELSSSNHNEEMFEDAEE